MAIDTAELLQPIAGNDPCGEDASFSDAFDRIREARRHDDDSLSQGEWQTELKSADWRMAIELSSDVLRGVSKDLQAAVWLGEALIGRHGYAGAADALDVLHGLLDSYWEGVHPLPDGEDLEERASKLAWFDTWATLGLKKAPLSSGTPAVTLVDWQSSREVDNLARQNASDYQEALDAGKLTGEAFDHAVDASGADFVRETLAAVDAAQASFDKFQALADQRFGRQSPSLAGFGDSLKRARQVLARSAQSLGLAVAGTDTRSSDAPSASDPAGTANTSNHGNTVTAGETANFAPSAVAPQGAKLQLPPVDTQSRAQLLRSVSDIATHFKRVEPHSPVSFLLERAVLWADMPLDQWLAEVVGDDAVLGSIRDRIGVSRQTE